MGKQENEIRLLRKTKHGEGVSVSFDTAMLIDGKSLKEN